MKTIIRVVIIGSFIAFLGACKKDNKGSNKITGRWDVVKDSTYVGVGAGNKLVVYNGQRGDYFDFRTDGKVYTKEGTVLDTLNYSVKSANQIVISKPTIIDNYIPVLSNLSLTAHTASIINPKVLTPGGEFGRSIYLAR